jgi:hypothetical protein
LPEAAAALTPALQTGTLLVTTGDCLAVRVYTQSPYTHVAAVVMRRGRPFVYESANGAGVRCQTLENYLASQGSDEIHVLQPQTPFSDKQAEQFETYLDAQLGRPYAIQHHVTGRRCRGLHCSEYVTDALMACQLIHANQPSRVSPASLREGLLRAKLYEQASTVRLEAAPRARPAPDDNWCLQLWHETKQCTTDCWTKTKRWFACR